MKVACFSWQCKKEAKREVQIRDSPICSCNNCAFSVCFRCMAASKRSRWILSTDGCPCELLSSQRNARVATTLGPNLFGKLVVASCCQPVDLSYVCSCRDVHEILLESAAACSAKIAHGRANSGPWHSRTKTRHVHRAPAQHLYASVRHPLRARN